MEEFYAGVDNLSGLIWGGTWNGAVVLPLAPMVVLLLGAGLYFMIRLKFLPIRRLIPAFGNLFRGRGKGVDASAGGDISPWNALSTALSGQVGTGNLAGVATALTLGGPGAIFWMWITAIVGMAAAFAESSLAVKYRETHPDGHIHGGPMMYIKNGLGKKWGWLAIFFAVGTMFSAVVTGNMTQANSIATAVEASANVPTWISGAVVAVLAFVVIIGGIKSIGSVAGKIVPAMALGYILVAIVMLIMHAEHVPGAFQQIFTYAFGLEQAGGGVAGYAVLQAVRFGVARGLFSNEAGQGSTAIAHAAAQTNDPVAQGEIAMLGAFIDTIVICTMTALVILAVPGVFPGADGGTVEYAWQSTLQGAQVTTAVFGHALPDITLFGEVISPGGIFIAVALALFAFTTIIGWSYYMEQAATYLFGDWIAKPTRYVWIAMVFIGALQQIDFVWKFGDLANASMAFPNLIAILLLSPVVIAMAKEKGRL
ncbi:alanine/glycine:cation symporter family protein [Hyphococcus sp.]|uniref:alanine/glycine:cation symporter family protein n=1 Tax=Hyphococcus sp. TaxID=2038636 RepID=UPI00207FB678|nr:MAG: sodium:alanine symporter [Marinicaulis sp.]